MKVIRIMINELNWGYPKTENAEQLILNYFDKNPKKVFYPFDTMPYLPNNMNGTDMEYACIHLVREGLLKSKGDLGYKLNPKATYEIEEKKGLEK